MTIAKSNDVTTLTFTSKELGESLDGFKSKILDPAIKILAAKKYILSTLKECTYTGRYEDWEFNEVIDLYFKLNNNLTPSMLIGEQGEDELDKLIYWAFTSPIDSVKHRD